MRNGRTVQIHIGKGVAQAGLLEHFIHRRIEELRDLGFEESCSVYVEAIEDARGTTHLATFELGSGNDPTVVQETGKDAFLAVRDASYIAERWVAERDIVRSVGW